MIHPHTELKYISDEVGYGVVATHMIPKGTITWVLDQLDRSFTQAQMMSFDQIYIEILDTYSYRNNKGEYVLCWDHGRFVNHSFNSNCLTTAYDFEIAIRDIMPGEQLTDDYGYLNISEPFRGISEGTKRKIVYPNDLEKYYAIWDRKLQDAFPLILRNEQPLQALIDSKKWDMILDVSKGTKAMDSILTCYYKQEIAQK